jgi:hypothetical protein
MSIIGINLSKFTSLCISIFFVISLLSAVTCIAEDEMWSGARPDGHAPIGMMADHTHHAGGFMLTYKYMYMSMDGMRNGTHGVSSQQVLDQFMVTPTDMDMQMHMFGIMYAPTDFWVTSRSRLYSRCTTPTDRGCR